MRRVAALAAAAVLLAGCGARVPPYFPTSVAAGAQPGGSASAAGSDQNGTGFVDLSGGGGAGSSSTANSSGTGGGSTGGGQASGPTGASSSGGGGGGGGGGGSTATAPAALSPANFSFDPQTQAAYCTGTAGNTASAPGITPTTIDVGNVSGLTGAVSDSFTPGPQAVEAVFAAINRYGGICGRQLKLDVEDDQQSSTNNAADVQYLIPKVFAFVGSLSDADNGGVSAMEQAGVADMGPAINVNRSNSSVYWSATGGSVIEKNGQDYIGNGWINGLKQYGDLPGGAGIAILGYSIPISALAAKQFGTVFQQAGVNICYENLQVPPAPGAQMGSIVATMMNNHCTGVFTTMDVVGNGVMLQDMAADNYHPKLISTTYEGYNPDQIQLAGGSANAQGLDIALNSVPLNAPEAGVQTYTKEMQTYEPGQPLTEFGLASWADAELFVYALIKTGRNPTRASFINTLSQVTGWTSDGAYGPYTPADRTGSPCVTNVVYQGSSFNQTWPASGLYCNNQFVPVPNS